MKLRDLESALGEVETFDTPVAVLEQYPTSAHLAARMLHVAAGSGDIEDQRVLDMGCGGGILGIGAAILGAGSVVGIDIDDCALRIASRNIENMQVDDVVDLVHADVSGLWSETAAGVAGPVDTVVMNPPFGTKRKGIDICFLQIAVQHAQGAVYSMHKSSTRGFIEKKALSWGTKPEVIAKMRFDIAALYDFHQRDSLDVEVDLWRLDCDGKSPVAMPNPHMYIAEFASLPSRSNGGKRGGKSGRGGERNDRGRTRGGRGK